MAAVDWTSTDELRLLLRSLTTATIAPPEAVRALPLASPDVLRDAPAFGILTVVFFVLNWGVRLMFVEPFVTRVVGMRQTKVKKCSQSVMEAIFYLAFTLIGLVVVPQQPWVWPSVQWWAGFMAGGHEIMRADLRCYYIMYIARYVQMCVSVLLEPKRKDFVEMFLHHAVTVVIIYLSYVYGWNRVGAVMMLLLDPADVPLHLAKICKYIGESSPGKPRHRWWQCAADRFFECFAVAFFITRLMMYSYVVWSLFAEGPEHIPNYGGPAGWTCIGLLLTLLILQFYWFYLIMKVAIKLLREGIVEDVRSDDDDDDAEDVKKVNGAKANGHSMSVGVLVSIVLGVALFGVMCQQAWIAGGGLEGLMQEMGVLLTGLKAVMLGDTATVKVLPYAPPDVNRDSVVFLAFSAGFFVLNWGYRLVVVEPVVRSILNLRRSQFAKFAQSVMEAVFYASFMVIGLRVVPSQEWVWPSARWWMGFADGGHEVMRSDLRCYYIMYVARYSQAAISVLIEPKRKDFLEMLLHHVVTVIVIYISYLYGWNRVGVVVMVLLDPADVPLHVAKLCKYTAEATKMHIWQFIADRLFEVFALVFFVTRLGLYGYVCWSAHIEASRYFPKGVPEWTCVALLYTLLVLQCYWFVMIIKVASKMVRGMPAEDPRSEDEAEDEPSATNAGKGTGPEANGSALRNRKAATTESRKER